MRIDTGVREGDAITPHYDPMIAKLIVHGDNREQALQRLALALDDYAVVGFRTTWSSCSALRAPGVRGG